jgi:starch phosphorylase
MRTRYRALCDNLWWCWDSEANALFQSLDTERWEELHHNPIALLEELAEDRLPDTPQLRSVESRFNAYMQETKTWCSEELPTLTRPVAYFCMEFAIHESLAIYSGGLGVLAGDHIKSASDLGIPFIGIGLLYREGYFTQVIAHGRQVAAYPTIPLEHTPLKKLDIVVDVPHGHHTYKACVWELKVGRARLLLLDSDLEENKAEHRALSQQLYGGDQVTRIAQEVLLGVGGVRVLRALGIDPSVFHMNEGHCAFLILERWKEELERGRTIKTALEEVKKTCVFTTHTPVQAGHDRFHWDLKKDALGGMREEMGLPEGAFMDLGRIKPGDIHEPLCMTVLALKGSRAANGVSALHGEVSRKMWKELYPSVSEEMIPIGHITNGVHLPSWMHPEVQAMLDHCSHDWREGVVPSLAKVSDAELWALRCKLRTGIISHSRKMLGKDWLIDGALTIGFARRFAPYKRGNLLFTDPDRLEKLLSELPVQLLFAGKAHPRDAAGQGILRDVIKWTRNPRFRGRVVFLPDYDMALGRRLVQGVDVWLNTPRRPREASGTSGMKAAMNLGINLSVLDGWWPEIYDGTNGWAIGTDTDYATTEEQDLADAESLYRLLEQQVIPEFYQRDANGIPLKWVRRMRHSLESCCRQFHTHRMVAEYARRYY